MGSEIVTQGDHLPVPTTLERVERRCWRISDLVVQAQSIESVEQGKAVLAGMDEALADYEQFRVALDRAMAPATVGQIVDAIENLRNSYPPRPDLKDVATATNWATYAQNLRDDVASLEPTVLTLQVACARLRRTVKWPDPAISEAYDAVKMTQAELISIRDFYVPRLASFRKQVLARIAEL
ncbi:hypothetical protein J4G48_0015265 [Bradyrhizobium barranii subsp. apii]|uniref:hypothetical protein n=1 Tax=Bradyrhizobium barranii TaxID=2992140 RepID=UPI001AA19995|nr:hypothetical protein [Bradyrhizobium barranii]UPT99323.1 hypothetical protein J4G48_0015265 [Bradyrhizobium barranii subsp. apii]